MPLCEPGNEPTPPPTVTLTGTVDPFGMELVGESDGGFKTLVGIPITGATGIGLNPGGHGRLIGTANGGSLPFTHGLVATVVGTVGSVRSAVVGDVDERVAFGNRDVVGVPTSDVLVVGTNDVVGTVDVCETEEGTSVEGAALDVLVDVVMVGPFHDYPGPFGVSNSGHAILVDESIDGKWDIRTNGPSVA